MRSLIKNAVLVTVLTMLCLAGPIARAEIGILVVHVTDVQRHPVPGLKIGVEGDGGSAITNSKGEARIKLAPQTKAGSWVHLQILESPPGTDLVIVSPWDYQIQVPSLENKPDTSVEVVVVQRGNREALESGAVLAALAANINKANAPKSVGEDAVKEDPKANLELAARQYGLTSGELDKAIRAWGAKTSDPYDAGLAALYARNYDAATSNLQDSLKQREGRPAADQEAVADAACFLGQSLYEQTKYRESVTAYQRCLQIRANDPKVMNSMAESLYQVADYKAAELLFRQALAVSEKALGPEDPTVAKYADNIGQILRDKGDLEGALTYTRRALQIDEKVYGPVDPNVARAVNDIAMILRDKGDLSGALTYAQRALLIDEKVYGPDHPNVARDLNSVGALLYAKGDYAGALPRYRRALAIREEVFGAYHPLTAQSLNNLAALLEAKGDSAGAESLYRLALAIDEKALGPDHPFVATDLSNLAALLYGKGNYDAAEPLMRHALAIDEKTLGPDHPDVARDLNNLAVLLEAKGDYAGAELPMRDALAIREKVLVPDDPNIANSLNNLAAVLVKKGDYAGAEPLLRRALMIDEKSLGADHSSTRKIKKNLDNLLRQSAKASAPKARN